MNKTGKARHGVAAPRRAEVMTACGAVMIPWEYDTTSLEKKQACVLGLKTGCLEVAA